MRFYRNSYYTCSDGSNGFEWFTSVRKARAAFAEARSNDMTDDPDDPWTFSICAEPIDIKCSKLEVLLALNQYADHADNG
jgi:hypothetical protein